MTNRSIVSLATIAITSYAVSATAQPAFPGAEGFAAAATGGRGGSVLRVTTLSPTGPGSLQEALDTPGARFIVFTVSGVIEGDIVIPHGDVTIAGQTAPGAGITIAGRLVADYDAEPRNIVVRHLRVRPTYDGSPGEQFDAVQFSTASLVMLDHVTISWGVDETLDLYESQDVTLQWSTIEESATMGHPEGEHNYGMIQGPDGRNLTVHHNLFVHHKNRNPAVANGPADVVNNVAYNVRHGFVHHNPATGPFNIVGNSYLAGPDDDLIPFFFDDENGYTDPSLSYYLADNYIDDPGVFTGTVESPWMTPFAHPSFEHIGPPESFRSATPHDFTGRTPDYVPVTTQPSGEAMATVLECAGGFPRDAVTLRVLAELDQRTGSWGVHEPDDLLEGLTPGVAPADGDADGMPDAWETGQGLDPAVDDSDTIMPTGYTAIETYANELAEMIACAPPGPGPSTSSSASGAGSTAGSGMNSGAGSGAGTGSGSGGAGGAGAEDGDGDGCGCSLHERGPGRWVAAALAAIALVARSRRRRLGAR